MASTNFVNGTLTDPAWFNDVNDWTYNEIGGPSVRVSNIASLRALPVVANCICYVEGYYTSGDGGGGWYRYVSTDTTTADDGGSVIVGSNGGRWYLKADGVYSVLQFGAKADADYSGAGTDSTTAFQSAIDAAWYRRNTASTTDFGGIVLIPAGNYKITDTLLIHPMISFVGAGKYVSSLIVPSTFNKVHGVLYINANTAPFNGAASLPTIVKGINISSVTGGVSSTTYGIYTDKNATFISDVWVAGFLNGGTGIVLLNTDIFLSDWVTEYCTYGVGVYHGVMNIDAGVSYLCDTGMVFDNGTLGVGEASPVVVRGVRTNQCTFYGFQIKSGCRRISFSDCSATNADRSKFSTAGMFVDGSADITITGFRGTLDIAGTTPSTTGIGLYIKNSTAVTVTGGICKGWANGYVIEGGADVGLDNIDAYGNYNRGVLLNGGDQIIVSNSTCANNGLGGGSGIGIESSNTSANATHQVLGCITQGASGGVQNIGIKASLTDNSGSTGQTYISGGTVSLYNNTSQYQLSGRVDKIFTDGAFPTNRAFNTLASAATITLPPSSAGKTVLITGNINITSIFATGYEGAEYTLLFQSTPTVVDGSNLKLNGNFVATADDTLKIVCDGTNWYEISRSAN